MNTRSLNFPVLFVPPAARRERSCHVSVGSLFTQPEDNTTSCNKGPQHTFEIGTHLLLSLFNKNANTQPTRQPLIKRKEWLAQHLELLLFSTSNTTHQQSYRIRLWSCTTWCLGSNTIKRFVGYLSQRWKVCWIFKPKVKKNEGTKVLNLAVIPQSTQ